MQVTVGTASIRIGIGGNVFFAPDYLKNFVLLLKNRASEPRFFHRLFSLEEEKAGDLDSEPIYPPRTNNFGDLARLLEALFWGNFISHDERFSYNAKNQLSKVKTLKCLSLKTNSLDQGPFC